MLRRLLTFAFVAFAVLGLRSAAYEQALVAEEHSSHEAHDACCPCDDDCTAASCACVAVGVVVPPRVGVPDRRAPALGAAWALAAEQHARDRTSVPPTPPPIG